MPINTDLNRNPYYDDYDPNDQFYRVLFKPSFPVQARELTQLQTILQNQVEQFGDNIFKEGSIIKGCTFTELRTLSFVRLANQTGFDPTQYVGEIDTETGFEIYYELVGSSSQLRASIEAAARGTQTAFPNLNTFFINYLNTSGVNEVFQNNEELIIQKKAVDNEGNPVPSLEDADFARAIVAPSNGTGNSFGIKCSEGIIYQKGHFLYVQEQLLIVSKYTNVPNNVSVGFEVDETIVSYLQDESLLDNANGSPNQNAPGADRLKLVPRLAVKSTPDADSDTSFFTIARYINGNAVLLRDVSQYNVLGEEFARRTYEESGNYISKPFKVQINERADEIYVEVGPGTAYVKGFRVENKGNYQFNIDQIDQLSTTVIQNQPISIAEYGPYLKISTLSGNFNIPNYSTVSLRSANTLSEIGTAIVKNVTPDKIYIFGIKMNSGENFSDVSRLIGTSGYADIASTALRATKASPFIFDTGNFSVKSLTDISMAIRTKTTPVVATSGAFSIVAPEGEDFSVQNDDLVVIDSSNVYKAVSSVSTSLDSKTLSVQLQDTTLTGNVSVYYNKRIQLTTPYSKVSKETYIKSNYSSSNRKYNLGFPDVYEIVSITDSGGADVTSSFKLKTNQNSHFYDHSYIEYIPGRREPATGLMTIRLKVFELNAASGNYFFTIDSYPDDSSFSQTKIPTFKSASGKVYNLRECVDFRPYVNKLSQANYNITNAASAPTVPSAIDITPVFSGSPLIPALKSAIYADVEVYNNRTDVVALDSYGIVNYIKGEESMNSRPAQVGELMPIAELYVPGYPAISTATAVIENKKDYAVKITSRGVRNYTMKDIAKIDESVKRLTYYTSLNALETATESLNVTDQNGLTRFKNGIIVDTFSDFTIADTSDTSFRAGLDFTEKTLMPPVRTLPINLVIKNYNSEEGVQLYPRPIEEFGDTTTSDIAILTKDTTDRAFITQPYATNFRNCVSNFYKFTGKGYLYPEYDSGPDVVNNPSINFSLDVTPYFEDLVDNIQEFIPLTSSSTRLIGSNTSTSVSTNGAYTATTTTSQQTYQDTQRQLVINETAAIESQVGDFVTNVQFSPFMRPKEINIVMYGLKANTRHWVFFDKVDVNANVAPASINNNLGGQDIARSVSRTGSFGDELYSDANGVLACVFSLPAETFYVGDRTIDIVNVDQYTSIGSGSNSGGFLIYRAYNFSVEKSGLTISTRAPDFRINSTITNRDVTNRSTDITYNAPAFDIRSCFVKGTLVTMSDGSYKKIEEVLIGETLLGQDGTINTVIEYDHPPLAGRQLIGINGSGPFMTPEHPLYTKEGWKSYRLSDTLKHYPELESIMVGELQPGDEIVKDDGSYLVIETLEVFDDEPDQQVFNFILNGNNTYFADGLLAHNRTPADGKNDPISQTFFVKKNMADQSSSVFVTKLDVFFKSKSSTRGVEVQLRETVNGYPTYEVLPFSRTHLDHTDVNVSDDGTVPTTVTFSAPIRLDADKEYAFVIQPDGADPDYMLYTSKVGGTDFATSSPVTQDWGDGVLFTSTNNRAWQSYQDEDIKFTLYRANFSNSSAQITLTNDNNEFFTITNPIGVFDLNELVYKETAAGISIGVENGSATITSSGTPFTTLFNVGDYVLIEGTNVPKNIYKIADPQGATALLETTIIASTASATATATPIVAGNLAYYNRSKPNFIMLEKSSARLTKSFAALDTIEGLRSGATATISSVDDIILGYIQPMITRANETITNVVATGEFTDVSNINNSYTLKLPFDNKTEFNERGMQLRSRSNDLSRTSPFDITLTLSNSGSTTASPIVDIETAALLGYQYYISNDAEANPENSVVYISKEIELADGFDASDFILYVTGYRPNGTDIKAYIKAQNAADQVAFGSADWIELEKTEGQTMYSSTSNINDFREYVYGIPASSKDNFGEYTYTSINGNFTGFKKFAIRIELLSDTTYRVPRVADYRGIALA